MDENVLDLTVHFEPIVRVIDELPVAHELLLRPVGGGELHIRAAHADVDMAWVTGFALDTAAAVLERSPLPAPRQRHPGRPRPPRLRAQPVRPRPGRRPDIARARGHRADTAQGRREVRDTLIDLRRVGVRIAVDDFGDGWADAERVAVLCPDIIKVRLSHLRSPDGFITAVALQDLAQRHHAQVVVEQIESRADLRLVRSLGFTYAQGWLWDSRPVDS